MSHESVKRGDIFYADLGSDVVGSEQKGLRPVVIVQNDIGNLHSPTTIVVPVTAKHDKTHMPTHVCIPHATSCLTMNSVILVEQLRTIDKTRLKNKLCTLNDDAMKQIDVALKVSLGL